MNLKPLALTVLACAAGNGEPIDRPSMDRTTVTSVGANVAVLIVWTPGSTDSIYFRAFVSGVQTAQVRRSPPYVIPDTLILGPRPAPGVTVIWTVMAEYWYTDRGTPTRGETTLGTASYTEPMAAGVPPTFGPLGPADTGLVAMAPGPVGVIVVFSAEQVQAIDTIPECYTLDIIACAMIMSAAGLLDSTTPWPSEACGMYSYPAAPHAALTSIADTSAAGNTHYCMNELTAMGYPRAAAALDSLTKAVTAGAITLAGAPTLLDAELTVLLR